MTARERLMSLFTEASPSTPIGEVAYLVDIIMEEFGLDTDEEEGKTLRKNLTATQQKCNELLEENRYLNALLKSRRDAKGVEL